MRIKVMIIAGIAAVAMSAGPGCRQGTGIHMVKSQFDPNGRKIVIIPFRDPAFDHFESDDGHVVADHTGSYIVRHKITPVVYERLLPAGVRTIYKENADAPQAAWKEIADALGCDLVLVGQIEEIDAGTPDEPKRDRGTLLLSARLLDVRQGCKVVWRMNHGKVVYPDEWEKADLAVPVDRLSHWGLKKQLLMRAGEIVGKNFHDSPGATEH